MGNEICNGISYQLKCHHLQCGGNTRNVHTARHNYLHCALCRTPGATAWKSGRGACGEDQSTSAKQEAYFVKVSDFNIKYWSETSCMLERRNQTPNLLC